MNEMKKKKHDTSAFDSHFMEAFITNNNKSGNSSLVNI